MTTETETMQVDRHITSSGGTIAELHSAIYKPTGFPCLFELRVEQVKPEDMPIGSKWVVTMERRDD